MKTLVVLAAALFALSHGFAASTGITLRQKNPPAENKPAEPKPEAVKPVEEKPAPEPAPAKPAVKKVEQEKMGVIPGMTIARPNGTFLGFELVDGKFKVSFYDKKKKPMAVDVDGGLVRWPNVRGSGDQRSPLNVSGTALVAVKIAPPPYNYTVYITLLKGDGDAAKAVESYNVMFRG